MRTVIGGVGYRYLRDHSLGISMADDLESFARPPALLVEDLSYGPGAVGQWFLDEARMAPITRAIFVSAVGREDGRPAGTVRAYRWDRHLPSAELIQSAVTEAVTGIILLDNTLVVTEWMHALPPEVIVIEVEPLEHAFGDGLSVPMTEAYEEAKRLALMLAGDVAASRRLPVHPLGGGWVAPSVERVSP